MARVFAPTVQYQAPSLDEMLKPLTMYSEAYDKIQKEYDAEEDRAAMLEALAGGNDPNAESYEYMKPYYDLREQVANDMLHNTNLNVRRQRLRDLRNMWRDKGIKAQLGIDAYTKYKDAVNKTPGAIYNSHSLMDFINNPQLQYSVIDPKDIESRGSAIFQTVAKNLPPQYAGTFLNNAMVMLKQGLSAEDIANIDGPNSPYIGIVENLRNLYGETYNNLTPEAQAAYERQKAANRTYEFADEKTRKQIAYMSDYYLSTLPEDVKAAWQATLEATGINPFPNGYTSTLAQLSVEQDFRTGGNYNIFGDTFESGIAAVQNILERIDNPLAETKESDYAKLENEKEFYSALLANLQKREI